ncbi:hypothetical protein BQ8482_380212 [Mesorhizobium delmotii]|uniref:Uncharacterized protein n=1 Tax=Mesorhizobium delmotii TaxID=1631247 RepID=A0A2P9AS92_9HYPH|nr:hypothetical protein BQ8482_380212 [Mesorhizobium delmotii]
MVLPKGGFLNVHLRNPGHVLLAPRLQTAGARWTFGFVAFLKLCFQGHADLLPPIKRPSALRATYALILGFGAMENRLNILI